MRVEEFIFVSVAHGELEISLARFLGRRAWPKRVSDVVLDSAQQGTQDILPVLKAAVDRGSIRTRCFGHRSHRESLVRSLLPQLLGGIQNARL
jgi:hypothetical protein